ncbi:hypothetical protein C8Q79DRAFT_1013651 [Trametes meyenii]|nr:hypothetical protein C8Q79DRAFT_1013651 [Trametes meyenii]
MSLEGLQLTSIYSLLVEPLPGLSVLHVHGTTLEAHSKILRMRLPFFAALSVLTLQHVQFSTPRALLNIVWACPNISVLKLFYPNTEGMSVSPAGAALLNSTCEHLRTCRKLVSLRLELTVAAGVEILSLPGGVFGSALTELFLQYTPVHMSIQTLSWFSSDASVAVNLSTFLGGSFPSLHTLKVQLGPTIEPARTFLALSTLAKGLASRESIKTVVLELDHIKLNADSYPYSRRRRTTRQAEKARVSPYVVSLLGLFPHLQVLRVELVCTLAPSTTGTWVDYIVGELNTQTSPPSLEIIDCKGYRLYPPIV